MAKITTTTDYSTTTTIPRHSSSFVCSPNKLPTTALENKNVLNTHLFNFLLFISTETLSKLCKQNQMFFW